MDVYLFGINSVAMMISDFLKDDQRYALKGFILSAAYYTQCEYLGYPVLELESFGGGTIINCVGYTNTLGNRKAIYDNLLSRGLTVINYVHPMAIVNHVEFGQGNIVFPNVVIEQRSVVGNGNLFYGGNYICHDAVIGNFNWFSCNSVLAGSVNVGDRNFFGINCSVRDSIIINNKTTIGAGAVVLKEVPDRAVVVGNPGKILRYNEVVEL